VIQKDAKTAVAEMIDSVETNWEEEEQKEMQEEMLEKEQEEEQEEISD
jgi:hypothetical protein